MKDYKTIEMFESIPKFETYSKYSQTLSKKFKHASLKTFLHDLKNPQHSTSHQFNQFTRNTTDTN